MTSFTFLVPDADAARFDRIAEGQGGRSALLRRLVGAVLAQDEGDPFPMVAVRSGRADQRLEVLLTAEEVSAIEAFADERGMKRSAWLTSLVRHRIHRAPEPVFPEAKMLEAIRSELRRIGVNLNQIAQAAHGGEGRGASDLGAFQDELREWVSAIGAARRGDLDYWAAPE